MSTRFHIRPASVFAGDGRRLLTYFDSQLSWLQSTGSGAQWGSTPFSNNQDKQAKYLAKVERSEACMGQQTLSHDWVRVYIAEAEVLPDEVLNEIRSLARENGESGKMRVPVAAMILEGSYEDYVREILPEQDEQDPFVFMTYLLSDRRVGSVGKGAGAALITHAKDKAGELGVKRLCSDCWRGNDRKLVR